MAAVAAVVLSVMVLAAVAAVALLVAVVRVLGYLRARDENQAKAVDETERQKWTTTVEELQRRLRALELGKGIR